MTLATSRWLLGLFLFLAMGCALPGKLYRVAPSVHGNVSTADLGLLGDASLELHVSHRESFELFAMQTVHLDEDGRFYFDATMLAVAGHEFSKTYRIDLRLRRAANLHLIWRVEASRLELAGAIELDCDLDRPSQFGQPCQVLRPLTHPWLVSRGKRTFERLCTTCHGENSRTNLDSVTEIVAPDLRRIAERNGQRFDRSEVAEKIEGRRIPKAHANSTMPVWGERLSRQFERYADGDELIGPLLDPLVIYLESIQTAH